MHKVLFLDLACHRVTRSSEFFIKLLEDNFAVTTQFVRDRFDAAMPRPHDVGGYDCIICWQLNPPCALIKAWKKPVVCVPMYDGETNNAPRWRRYALMGVRGLCFCRAEAEICTRYGIENVKVKYFPPVSQPVRGEINKAFYWDRGGLDVRAVRRLLPSNIELRVRKNPFGVGDEARSEYIKELSGCGFFVASRSREGIGMGFLEAMAMGKCVVANNDGTMNEYIEHEVNGLLVDFASKNTSPSKYISDEQVCRMQKAAYDTSVDGRRHWENVEARRIVDFIERTVLEYKELNWIGKAKWWGLLPMHFFWDVKIAIANLFL